MTSECWWSHAQWKSAYGSIRRCLGYQYQHAEADPDRSTLWSGYGKMWSFALRQHLTARMSRYLTICWAAYRFLSMTMPLCGDNDHSMLLANTRSPEAPAAADIHLHVSPRPARASVCTAGPPTYTSSGDCNTPVTAKTIFFRRRQKLLITIVRVCQAIIFYSHN